MEKLKNIKKIFALTLFLSLSVSQLQAFWDLSYFSGKPAPQEVSTQNVQESTNALWDFCKATWNWVSGKFAKQEQATTILQASVRGNQARKQFQQEQAAQTIQSHLRGTQSHQEFNNLKEKTTTLQAAIRGYKAHKKIEQKKNAATKIQSALRGNQARNNLREQRNLRCLRMLIKNAEFKKQFIQNDVAKQLQAAARGHLVRKQYQEEKKEQQLTDSFIDLRDSMLGSLVQVNKQPSIINPIDLSKLDDSKVGKKAQRFNTTGRLVTFPDKDIEAIFKKFQTDNGRVRKIFRYKPDNKKNDKRLLFVVVHGTFATDSIHYYQLETENFNNMVTYAQQVADERGMQADIISYQWAGANTNNCRIEAGKRLGVLLDLISTHYSHITTLAHSHGCNVVNTALNELVTTTVDVVIHLSSPVMEKDGWMYEPDPSKFKEFYSSYSLHDIVQFSGSWNLIQWGSLWEYIPLSGANWTYVAPWAKKGYITDGRRYSGKNVVNILFTHDNIRPGHSELATWVTRNIKGIIAKYKQNYSGQNDISVNIVPQDKCHKHKVDHINMSLAYMQDTQTTKERTKFPEQITQYSYAQCQEHEKVYGYKKDANEWTIYKVYQLLKKTLN